MSKLLAYTLAPLVRRNYTLRAQGKAPDEWYWADVLLLRLGYFVTFYPEMKLEKL
jgi:hypothetical protein